MKAISFVTEYSTVALILYSASASPLQPLCLTVSLQIPRVSTMASKPRQSKGRDGLLSTLDVLIAALGIAGSTCPIHPAQIAISSANALLTMIRVPSSLSLNDLPTHVYVLRIPSPTKRIMSVLGCAAVKYVKPLAGVWRGGNWTNLASLSSGQLSI